MNFRFCKFYAILKLYDKNPTLIKTRNSINLLKYYKKKILPIYYKCDKAFLQLKQYVEYLNEILSLNCKQTFFFYLYSYPPDSIVNGDPRLNGKNSIDDDFFKSLALRYSVKNKKLYHGNGCDGIQTHRGVSIGKLCGNPRFFFICTI